MFALLLLLVPLCRGAPQPETHYHGTAPSSPSCDESHCQVSENTLNSALATFLCISEDEIKDMHEKEKKQVLAKKIAPHLTTPEDELSKMDSARLVPLVNLVLHDHDHDHDGHHDHAGHDHGLMAKSEEEYIRAFRKGLAAKTNQNSAVFRGVNPIVLGMINCQNKMLSNLQQAIQGAQRSGRGLPGVNMTQIMAGNLTSITSMLGMPGVNITEIMAGNMTSMGMK